MNKLKSTQFMENMYRASDFLKKQRKMDNKHSRCF